MRHQIYVVRQSALVEIIGFEDRDEVCAAALELGASARERSSP